MEKYSYKWLDILVCAMLLGYAMAQNDSSTEEVYTSSQAYASTELTTTEAMDETKAFLEVFEQVDNNLKQLVKQGIKTILPMVMEKIGSTNVSSTCMAQGLKVIAALREARAWAFSLLDASGKAVDGLFTGSLATLGEYDQCLDIKALHEKRGKNYGKVIFTGKYCAIDIRPPLPKKSKSLLKIDYVLDELKDFSKKGTVGAEAAKSAHFFYFLALRFGICVPSGCTEHDIGSIITSVFQQSKWKYTVNRCEIKEKPRITPVIMFASAVYVFLFLLLVTGTAIDLIYNYREKPIRRTGLRILTAFSFVTNFRKLTDVSAATDSLGCLNAVRFLSITWIILGHTYLNVNFQIFRGLRKIIAYRENFAFQTITNAFVAVDTFFFIGGFLVCYVTMKLVKEMKKPFNIPLYLVHRIWRLLPLYAMVILATFFVPIIGYGPVWHDVVDAHLNKCYKNWWINLIFLNNFLDTKNICGVHTWYVASDLQLYIFSLLILLPLMRWPKVGISLAVVFTFISIVVTSVVVYLNDLPPTMLYVNPDVTENVNYQAEVYFKPYAHAGPYFIGILAGYLLTTKPKIRFSRRTLIFGWCAAAVCSLSALYGVLGWNRGRDPTLWETLLYSSCHRTAWALGVAWVIICCTTGQGGVVNYILTWKVWIPVGRLTYAAYLIHPLIQLTILGNFRMKLQPHHDFAVWMYFGHLAVTYGASFGLSMLIEAPCMQLEKILLGRQLSPDDKENNKFQLNGGTGATKKTMDSNEKYLPSETQNAVVYRL